MFIANAFRKSRLFIATLVMALFWTYTLAKPAQALVAPLNVVAADDASTHQADLQKIQKFLESKVVRERLVAMGLTDQQIDSRLQQLNDAQLHQVAMQIDKTYAGAGPVGFLIGVGFLVVLVLLIIYLAKRV